MSGPLALSARGLRVQRGRRWVIDGVDVDLMAGRWVSVVGPNGAGKSSLLLALAGLLPFQGQIGLQGRPLSQWPRTERARELAWLGQGQEAADDLTVHDVVRLGRLPHQGWHAQPTPLDEQAVERAMQETGTWPWRDRALGSLSGGERQRVLLARALAVEAPVLLMDEPLANLDPPHQVRWWQTVRQLLTQGTTVVSVLHEVSMALLADEVWVMQAGRLLHQGQPGDPATHRALSHAFEQQLAFEQVRGRWVAMPVLPVQAGAGVLGLKSQ